ncbi:FCD domain-containing protein [Ancylobacter mangrovi]|uniref:FCD domain-containing protein n=1 Tax=Ancylobacter mangrovi TaxID=2972472 RepID=A0A9X2PE89_9HYPH|nr:FCD domain-containing protein [Ancylobacter mangrovi]MCS0496285.1 FCD domain-containing protein [Ancylobacter mangrovi]MCS0504283.1 FCD domain-containing protein [Ancylobacter mangrovi]
MSLQPVATNDDDTTTLGIEIYSRLRRDLIAGHLKPGERLRFRQMSAAYGVGIAPLREALSRLVSDQLVRFEGHRGYTVAPLSLSDLHDLCALRTELSCNALRRSIASGDENWEAEILAALHRLERAPIPHSVGERKTIDEWEQRHDRFHRSLIAACGSPWLLHFCGALSDHFQRYRRAVIVVTSASEPLLRRVREQHRTVAEAAIARDANRATAILAEHFQGSVDVLMRNYEEISRSLSAGNDGR